MPHVKHYSGTSKLLLKLLGGGVLVVVMGIGFLGYLTPSMRINWETIATMCGF
jgi:hypothetical protein